jgi:hypothetical protein
METTERLQTFEGRSIRERESGEPWVNRLGVK